MEFTLDNYREVIQKIQSEISRLKNLENNDISEGVDKISDDLKSAEKSISTLIKDNDILKIGIVGQVKAGKSSFMNSLFFEGENVLPRASTPMTAGLTVLQYGTENTFEVEYYNTDEWSVFEKKAERLDRQIREIRQSNPECAMKGEDEIAKEFQLDDEDMAAKELVSTCTAEARSKIQNESLKESKSFNDIKDLQGVLNAYVGSSGKFTPIVKCLTLSLHDERLKGMQVVDTPGVNDPVVSREMRTREFLASCHGVFFLSFSSRFFDKTDLEFLSDRVGSEGIGRVVLIASKFDSVLQDVGRKFQDDLDKAINSCKRSLKKQFNDNMANASYKGRMPIFEYSSGIGYSISQKPVSEWDDTETNVVQQMRYWYPSFFEEGEMTKEEFLALSQIDKMKNTYVDEEFKAKKDEMIAEKTKSYIDGLAPKIEESIKKVLETLEIEKQRLEENDLADMARKKETLKSFMKSFEEEYGHYTQIFNNKVSKSFKEWKNSLSLHFEGEVPLEKATKWFKGSEKGMLWGTNSYQLSVTYNKVDYINLTKTITNQLESFLKQKADEFAEKIENLSKEFINDFGKLIAEKESEGLLKGSDGRNLRRLLDVTNSEINDFGTLEISDIRDESIKNIKEIIFTEASTDLGYKEKVRSKEETRSDVENLAKKKIEVMHDLLLHIYSATLQDLGQEVENKAEVIMKGVVGNKDKFLEVFNKRVEEDQKKLEQQLKAKEKPLKEYTEAIEVLKRVI